VVDAVKPQRVLTAGTFDCPHPGHIDLLAWCAKLGTVTVAVNTDEFVEKYKGARPVLTFDERKTVIGACRYVDAVIPNNSDSLAQMLQSVKPDYLVIGSDWARKDYYAQIGVRQDWLDEHRIALVYVPRTREASSSEIKGRLTTPVSGFEYRS
jgi:glycerol-3-phosphate cytidylyltransferase